MLYDPNLLTAAATRFETKSADAPLTSTKPASRQTARRYRPRRTTSDRVREALLMLSDGRGDLVTHEETNWTSITFSGTRHEVALEFVGAEAVEAGEDFIAILPEHEFTIPGQLVADATIKEVDHQFGSDERMAVTAVLLLLEES